MELAANGRLEPQSTLVVRPVNYSDAALRYPLQRCFCSSSCCDPTRKPTERSGLPILNCQSRAASRDQLQARHGQSSYLFYERISIHHRSPLVEAEHLYMTNSLLSLETVVSILGEIVVNGPPGNFQHGNYHLLGSPSCVSEKEATSVETCIR